MDSLVKEGIPDVKRGTVKRALKKAGIKVSEGEAYVGLELLDSEAVLSQVHSSYPGIDKDTLRDNETINLGNSAVQQDYSPPLTEIAEASDSESPDDKELIEILGDEDITLLNKDTPIADNVLPTAIENLTPFDHYPSEHPKEVDQEQSDNTIYRVASQQHTAVEDSMAEKLFAPTNTLSYDESDGDDKFPFAIVVDEEIVTEDHIEDIVTAVVKNGQKTDALLQKINQLERELDQSQKRVGETTGEYKVVIEQRQKVLADLRQKVDTEKSDLEKLSAAYLEIDTLTAALEVSKKELEAMSVLYTQSAEALTESQAEIAQLKSQVDGTEDVIHLLSGDYQEVRQEKDGLEKHIFRSAKGFQNLIENDESELIELNAYIQQLESDCGFLNRELAQNKNELKDLQLELDSTYKELESANEFILNLRARNADYNNQEKKHEEELTALKQLNSYLSDQILLEEEKQEWLRVANGNLTALNDFLTDTNLTDTNNTLNTLQEQLTESREKLSKYIQTNYLPFRKKVVALTSAALLTLGSLTSFYLIAKNQSTQESQPVSVASREAEDIGLSAGNTAVNFDVDYGSVIVEPAPEPAAHQEQEELPADWYSQIAAADNSQIALLVREYILANDGYLAVSIPEDSTNPCLDAVTKVLIEMNDGTPVNQNVINGAYEVLLPAGFCPSNISPGGTLEINLSGQ